MYVIGEFAFSKDMLGAPTPLRTMGVANAADPSSATPALSGVPCQDKAVFAFS